MKSKEALYRLVKSLEKDEYQHVKKELQRNKRNSNLVRLLKGYWKSKNYDRGALKELAKENNFGEHLQQTENQLYDKIMFLLKTYAKKEGVYQLFIGLLQEVEIFYRKKLTAECRQALQKAKKIAQDYELYEFELSLFYWDFYLRAYFVYDWNKPDHVPDFESYLANAQNFSQLIQTIIQERQLAHQYPIDHKQLMGNEYLIQDIKTIQSPYQLPRLNFYFHLMQGGICFQLRDWSTAQQHYLSAKEILENNTLLEVHTDALPNLYITLMSVYIKQQDYMAFEPIQKEAHTFIFNQLSPLQQERILPFYYQKVHLHFLFKGAIVAATELSTSIHRIYRQLQGSSNEHFLSKLAYQLALQAFLLEQYPQTIEWINKAWTYKKGIAYAVRYAMQLLEIMVHFELEHYEIIPSLSDSFYRFVKKYNLLSDYERKIIRYVKKFYFMNVNGSEAQEMLQLLKDQLQQLATKEQYYTRKGSYINFYAWVDSKLKQISYGKSLENLLPITAQ